MTGAGGAISNWEERSASPTPAGGMRSHQTPEVLRTADASERILRNFSYRYLLIFLYTFFFFFKLRLGAIPPPTAVWQRVLNLYRLPTYPHHSPGPVVASLGLTSVPAGPIT